jgi:tetratricopeptide (TPR) repeat protein
MSKAALSRLCLIALMGGTTLCPMMARAQPTAAAQRANDLAKEGKAKYDQGDWAGALALFESAEAVAHSPVLLLYAARCQRNLGRLGLALGLLRRVVDEQLPHDAAAPFVNAQRDAIGDLQALEPRIPKIIIDRSRAPASWVVAIDGAPADGDSVSVDPGAHVVTARADGVEQFRREISVAEASSATVEVLSAAAAPAPTATTQPDASAADVDDDTGAYAAGFVVLGVGAAGVGVGVALRVMALQDVAAVKDRCVDNSCLTSDAAVIDEAETLQTVSTILFAVGGAAMATGVLLLVLLPGDDAPSVALDVGPAYIGLRGAF